MPDTLDLDALEAALAGMTSLPWHVRERTKPNDYDAEWIEGADGSPAISVGSRPVGYNGCDHWLEFETPADRNGIVALVNAAPSLIATMRDLRTEASARYEHQCELLERATRAEDERDALREVAGTVDSALRRVRSIDVSRDGLAASSDAYDALSAAHDALHANLKGATDNAE